ncbi:DMT family transporter [Brevibacillus daliensis]|uniref:DMT family transporter n=1 Tax=Brevibacillus daliensis TaxID=2892995 RepID=UPI001E6303D3|nr:DMT family transporter [Brevibacillus daliensis]
MSRSKGLSSIDLMMISVVFIWGANYTIGKFGMKHLSADVFTLTRFIMVLPVLYLMAKVKVKNLAIEKKDIPQFLLAALVGITLYQTFFIGSLRYTTASNSSLLIAMAPLFTVMGLLIAKKEKLSLHLMIGSVCAIVGLLMIKGMADIPFSFDWSTLQGDGIALLASILFGLYPFTLTRLQKKYSSLLITFYVASFGTIFLALYSGAEMFRVDWGNLPAEAWGSLLFAAYPVTAWSLVVWNYGIQQLGSLRAMNYQYVIPVTAILVAMVWIGERMNGWQLVGTAFILFGVVMVRQGAGILLVLRKKFRKTLHMKN